MLVPKKVKFRKWQTGRSNPKTRSADTRGITLSFGSFGLKSETQARVKSTQIEAARKVISRTLTKVGKYWVRIFPDRPYTASPPAPRAMRARAQEVGSGTAAGPVAPTWMGKLAVVSFAQPSMLKDGPVRLTLAICIHP